MADLVIPTNQRDFRCTHCHGKIVVPKDLPPTSGPCPHCGEDITSPGDDIAQEAPVTAIQNPPAPEVLPDTPDAAAKPAAASPPLIPADLLPVKSEPSTNVELPNRDEKSNLNKPKKHLAPKATKKQRSGLIPAMLVLLAIFSVGGAVVYFASQEMGRNIESPTPKVTAGNPPANEANYLQTGWQKDARQLLRSYLAATTTGDRLPFILNGKALESQIESFYRDGVNKDADTPADGFTIHELKAEDSKRGLFMMVHDKPPLRVHAFFKRTAEGLKLDWEIFAQTKYRTLQKFVKHPESAKTGTFRVIIVEVVPDKGRAVAGTRTYRIVDPAHTGDGAQLNVKVDSEIGRTLSIINWRGTKENRPLTRTATVELKWSGSATAPELEISRFVCWEFLGLGGQDTPATGSTK